MDVISMHQAGFTQAVASLGTAFTPEQANLLRRYTENVLLAYDSDGAGIKAALRGIGILRDAGLTGRVINMKPYKDPDEFMKALGREAFQERIDHAENSFFFEIRILEGQFDMNDPESKTKFHREIAKKLCEFSEDVERDNYLQAIAEKYFIGIENLRKLVAGYAADAAAEYYGSLSADRIEQLGVDEKTVLRLYTEYALANKVYEYIIQDINPEISDDEARTITVQHIFLRTWTTDGSGARVRYSEDVKQSVYEKACGIREQAVSGEKDFLELASKYSEDPNITCSFGKGEMEAAFEEEAFSLETDEISPVIETDSGFHIIKCISTFDREQTELSKQEIVEQRRREVFGEEYDALALTLVRQLNTKLWDEITLVRGGSVDTVDFFEIYARFFP